MADERELRLPSDFALAAICAHPDDAEALAGGTLRLAVERGRKVAIVDLTAGEHGSRGNAALRATEAAAAARILGIAHRECLGLPDTALAATAEQTDRVVEVLRRLRPAIVVTHHAERRHPDHDAASALVTGAAYLAGLVNYRPDCGPAFRPGRIFHALSTLHHDDAKPTIVVDITRAWETKLAAVRAHESQFLPPPGTPRNALDEGLRNLELAARWHGWSVGVAYGEAFLTRAPMGVGDLLDLTPWRG